MINLFSIYIYSLSEIKFRDPWDECDNQVTLGMAYETGTVRQIRKNEKHDFIIILDDPSKETGISVIEFPGSAYHSGVFKKVKMNGITSE